VKACPHCYRIYPAEAGFCPQDGTQLQPYESVSAQPPPAEGDRFLGQTLAGRYEVRRIVADGGMGRVYEARDGQRDRRVALKVLHPEVARDSVAVERFKREYEISKDLPHDHIVEVLDFQQIGDSLFLLAMEFLEGEELRVLLKRDKHLPPARLVRIMSQVAIGLDEAHARQFVHRDLKPDNLFLCDSPDGDVVKILDFGSVRINKNRQMSKLTSLGTTIGSPFYMSPEQAQGAENLDHRADVFALGAIAYECLTGSVPFTGANGPAILLAILTKSPAPASTKAPEGTTFPPVLDDVIDDALAKKPETRTASVGAFADALGRAFGLGGDHRAWAKTPLPVLGEQLAAAASVMTAAADPFATDPFAAPPAAASAIAAPAPPPAFDARSAMDAAFEQASAGELAPVPKKSNLGLIVGIVVALLVAGGVAAFFATR
jgi:hypothetical protein